MNAIRRLQVLIEAADQIRVVKVRTRGDARDPSAVWYRVTWDREQWYEYELNGNFAKKADWVFKKSGSVGTYVDYIKKNCDRWEKIEK